MDHARYTVVYDVLRDGIGIAPVGVCLGMLLGLGFGIALLIHERKQRKPIGGLIVGLILWGTAALFGGGNVIYQHLRCVAWAKSGNYEVVEGRVTGFQPRSAGQKSSERFTVKGLTFAYSDSNLGQGGFRYPFGPHGRLQDGTRVRVAHRQGRILKLEIREN